MISMSRRIDSLVSPGKPENVAGAGYRPVLAPFLQHLAVVGDLVLTFLGGDEIVRVDVLQSDEHPADARLCGLFDEIRDLVTKRVDLDGEADLRTIAFAQRYQTVEQQLPIAVAGEIVVGDEEARDALGIVFADDLLEIVG